MIHNDSTQRRIDRARFWALSNPATVFYGSLACNLRDVIDPTVPTACTDGKIIRWSPTFVATLTDQQVRFVLLHEVLHCAQGHFWRLPLTREGNVAGDYAINRTLRSVSGLEMPKGMLDDRKFDKLAEEEILLALRQPEPPQPPKGDGEPQDGDGDGEPQDGDGDGEPQDGDGDGEPQDGDGDGEPQDGDGKGEGDGKPGDSKTPGKQQDGAPEDAGGCGGFEAPAEDAPKPADGKGNGPAKPATLREEWDRAVAQAAQIASSLSQGNLPAEAQRLLDRVRATAKPDWRAETADFIKSAIAARNDWSRQARRTATAPVIYPRRKVDDLGLVVFVRDTSGSIGTDVVNQFNAHIRDLIGECRCEAVILDCDAAVQAEYRLTAGDEVPDRAEGGGGTDFRPAFTRVAELIEAGEKVAGVVYLTDLYGTFPEAGDVDVASLWVATTDGASPIGRTVKIEL